MRVTEMFVSNTGIELYNHANMYVIIVAALPSTVFL